MFNQMMNRATQNIKLSYFEVISWEAINKDGSEN